MPNGIWVFIEQINGQIRKVSLEILGQGRKIADQAGEPLVAVLVGEDIGKLAQQVAEYGADQVYLLDSPELAHYATGPYTSVLSKLLKEKEAKVFLIGYTGVGKDLAPRLAQRLGVGLASDIIDMAVDPEGLFLFKRSVYTGNALSYVQITSSPILASVRPKSFPVSAPDPSREAEIMEADVSIDRADLKVVLQEIITVASSRPALTEAEFIIAGGRGMKGAENFMMLEELADAVGGAVGASRAACDSGWIDNSFQVGQTGCSVAPQLYIACGISGAIQHLAGIGSATIIVAINKDPEANIFDVADYGIVGDLFEIVPILTQEFKQYIKN